MSAATLISNATILDLETGTLLKDHSLLIEADEIAAVYPIAQAPQSLSADLTTIDAQGHYLMPGLIDAHVHVLAWTADIRKITRYSQFYTAARASGILRDMLMRGVYHCP